MDYRLPLTGHMAEFYSQWSDWLAEAYSLGPSAVRGGHVYRVNAFFCRALPSHDLGRVLTIREAEWHGLFAIAGLPSAAEKQTWAALKRFYEFAMVKGDIDSNPVQGHPRPIEAGQADLDRFHDRWTVTMFRSGSNPSVQKDRRQLANRLLKQAKLPKDPASFRTLTLDTFHRYFEANDLKGKRRRRVFSAFEIMLDAAVDQGYADKNVLTGQWHRFAADTGTVQAPKARTLSPEELADLERRVQLIPGEEWLRLQDLALVSLFYRLRMLPQHAFSLREHSDGSFSYAFRRQERQTIELDAESRRRIRSLLAALPYAREPASPIFWGPRGAPLDHSWLGKRWRTIAIDGGNLTARVLRNSSVEHAKAAGLSVDELQAGSRLKHSITIADGVEVDLPAFMEKYARMHPNYDR